MRLWHEALIPYLPRQQLLGQHRECCALRGRGCGKPHATVNYVFRHPYGWLFTYHLKVMEEMERRGYKPTCYWYGLRYRGKKCNLIEFNSEEWQFEHNAFLEKIECSDYIYPEHDSEYLQECLENLSGKGIHIEMGKEK